ncbi:MAG: OmpA family protein [Sulfuricurvum sp.]|nr:OmpA family protein [Sulfuricurvum sp.]
MIKEVILLSTTTAMLIFSGCSSKEPSIDKTANGSSLTLPTAAIANTEKVNTADTGSISSAAPEVINPNTFGTKSTNSDIDTAANRVDGKLSSIYFDYDNYSIRSDMEPVLTTDSALVKNKTVKLEGNCDEFGSDEYNYALGLKRANAVKQTLVDSGVSADSISMVSLGKSNPVCVEQDKECWSKNRRVDFKLL